MMESSLPKVPRKFHLLLVSSSAGRGCLSWAGLHAAGAAPVPTFRKPKYSPEERFKPMKLLKRSVSSRLKHSLGTSGLLLFCCRTALLMFLPTDTIFLSAVPLSPTVSSDPSFAFTCTFGSFFHSTANTKKFTFWSKLQYFL